MAIGYQLLSPRGLYGVAALRITIGLVLVGAAARSRSPQALRLLGWFILAVGVTTAFTGVARAHALLDWWNSQGWFLLRLPYLAATVVGVFITQALTAIHRDD